MNKDIITITIAFKTYPQKLSSGPRYWTLSCRFVISYFASSSSSIRWIASVSYFVLQFETSAFAFESARCSSLFPSCSSSTCSRSKSRSCLAAWRAWASDCFPWKMNLLAVTQSCICRRILLPLCREGVIIEIRFITSKLTFLFVEKFSIRPKIRNLNCLRVWIRCYYTYRYPKSKK